MATDTQTIDVLTDALPNYYRLNLEQFTRMAEAGVFPEDARIELLGGILVERMTKHSPYWFATNSLWGLLAPMVPHPLIVIKDDPVELGAFWRPEPDLAVLIGPLARHRGQLPTITDVKLLIEAADSSYRTDRGAKWHGYAETGVPTYWIVNLNDRQVEVYRNPAGKGSSAVYRSIEIFGIDASVPVIIDGVEVGQIAVKDIMP